jgi:hypothetical protein
MGIDTNEGYLGHDEIRIGSEDLELSEYVRSYQINGRIIYKDKKTGRFVSEKGLVKKTR